MGHIVKNKYLSYDVVPLGAPWQTEPILLGTQLSTHINKDATRKYFLIKLQNMNTNIYILGSPKGCKLQDRKTSSQRRHIHKYKEKLTNGFNILATMWKVCIFGSLRPLLLLPSYPLIHIELHIKHSSRKDCFISQTPKYEEKEKQIIFGGPYVESMSPNLKSGRPHHRADISTRKKITTIFSYVGRYVKNEHSYMGANKYPSDFFISLIIVTNTEH